MPTTIYSKMQQRYDTAAAWTGSNPILLAGEIGIESDTNKFKIGDGVTEWNSLSYAIASLSQSSIDQLADVDTSSTAPTNGQGLIWNATLARWVPGSVSGGGGSTLLTLTNQSLNLGAQSSVDFTINTGTTFALLAITSSQPAWVRVYTSATARSADTRITAGYPYPNSGSGFNAEIVTTLSSQTITFSPVPFCQGDQNGLAYVRLVNMSTSAQTINTSYQVLRF